MANPQVEDGYTKIANELLEALIRLMPGNTEARIMLAVIRKTYGWCKKEDCISINQLAGMTCKSRRMAIYAVQNLEAKRMLNVRRNKGRGHINEINKISLNKNYSEWVVQEKSSQYRKALENKIIHYKKSKKGVVQEQRGSARIGKKVVQYGCTHKRNIQKKIYSPNSDEIRMSELLFSLILQRHPGHKKPDFQEWARHVDRMIRLDNRSVEDIEKIIRWCQNDKFWQKTILLTEKLRMQFDKLWHKSGYEKRKRYF